MPGNFDAVNYYHSLLTFGVRPGLDRISLLLKSLGDPQKSLKFIHTAGTCGKGSVSVFLSDILTSAGYKTGLYTSPYVLDFRERIKIDGEMINSRDLCEITLKVKEKIDRLNSQNIVITEFEAITAAAFLYFKEKSPNIVVLETGLGGRFDATNVIESPILSVITSISHDHMKILGDSIEKIAFEKCGIIKNSRPVVTTSRQNPLALNVIREQSKIKNSPLYISDENCDILSESIEGTKISSNGLDISIPLPGDHQVENCLLALKAADVLKKEGYPIPDGAIIKGIESSKIPARCEIISRNPLVILDGCHNESSAAALGSLIEKYLKNKKINAVMGIMKDKDVDKIISVLAPKFNKVFAAPSSNPRTIDPGVLAEKIRALGVDSQSFGSVKDAYNTTLKETNPDDIIIICGSLYLCSDFLTDFG